MDSRKSWEHKSLLTEISEGMELAKQLRLSLSAASSSDTRQFLVQRILTSYENALLILNFSGPAQSTAGAGAIVGVPEPLVSANAGPCFDDHNKSPKDHQELTDVSKKRKMMAKWKDHVIRVSSENGIEGPHEDGYSWRKYGQKDILGAKHPRSYYRCTYRNTQSCYATKQVQRSGEDPTIFEITYKGKHTCSHGSNSVLPPPSPEQQEQKRNKQNNTSHQQQSQGNQMSFPTNLRVDTEFFEDGENTASPFSFTSTSFGCMVADDAIPSFECMVADDAILSSLLDGNNTFFDNFNHSLLSPAAGESNYYLMPPSQMRNTAGNEQLSEYGLTEIISANNSSTNSPIPDMDFPLEPVEIEPNFPFDTTGIFS